MCKKRRVNTPSPLSPLPTPSPFLDFYASIFPFLLSFLPPNEIFCIFVPIFLHVFFSQVGSTIQVSWKRWPTLNALYYIYLWKLLAFFHSLGALSTSPRVLSPLDSGFWSPKIGGAFYRDCCWRLLERAFFLCLWDDLLLHLFVLLFQICWMMSI